MRYLLCAATILILAKPAVAQEHVEKFVYSVHHALFGDIGSLTREINENGGTVAISTRANVRVELFGVSLHTIELAWDETWFEGRLRDFRGRTVRNRGISAVHAWSDGPGYVVEGEAGRTVAPAGLQPINPWSMHFVSASMLMSPESGKVYPASIEDAGIQLLNAAGRALRVRHYVLRAGTTNHLYFDDSGILVATEYADITGTVTIILKEVAPASLAAAR